MKTKSKPSANECKIFTKHSTALLSSKAAKEANAPKQVPTFRATERKMKGNGKQNIENSNIPSPQQNMKNRNFKPKMKKPKRLELESTISLVINQSTTSIKKHDLLDSLLYGEVDLTYSQDFNQKQQEGQQLLISGCDQPVNFKNCKNLSPIKSISEYSVTENENQTFVVQKVETGTSNAVLKLKGGQTIGSISFKEAKTKQYCILLRRLLIYFNEKPEGLLSFYYAIHQTIAKQDLYFKIREFMFQHSIIFKKTELNQLIEQLSFAIVQANKDSKKYQFCEENLEIMMERVFLNVNADNCEKVCNLWIVEDVYQKIFDEKDLISIWKLTVELSSEVPKEIEASFRQSRFCMSMDSHQFVHETDEKRKKDNINTVLSWLSHFIRPLVEKKEVPEEKMIIKISPPPAN